MLYGSTFCALLSTCARFVCHHIGEMYIHQVFVHVAQYGEWAIVTGATDGIGKAVSMELAKKGDTI